MNFEVVRLITFNTISNEWRNKALIFLAVITSILLALAVGVLLFMKEQYIEGMNLKSLGVQTLGVFYMFINFWSYLISIYFGVSSIKNDIESSVLPQILSFPISRLEFLMGRLFGVFAIVAGYYLISFVFATIAIISVIGEIQIAPTMILGFILNLIPNFAVILFSFAVGPYFGKLPTFLSTVIFTIFVTFANSHFLATPLTELTKKLTVLSTIQLISFIIFPHIATWGDIGNAYIKGTDHLISVWVEVPHLIVTMVLLFFFVNKLFKRYEA